LSKKQRYNNGKSEKALHTWPDMAY